MNGLKGFRKLDKGEVERAIRNSCKDTAIYVACDSNRFKRKTLFGVVVVLLKNGVGEGSVFAEKIWSKTRMDINTRLLKEVEYTIKCAQWVQDYIDGRDLEIHLDINPDYRHLSHKVMNQAVGWVKGVGFDVKVKPESWAAHAAADHLVR